MWRGLLLLNREALAVVVAVAGAKIRTHTPAGLIKHADAFCADERRTATTKSLHALHPILLAPL